MSTLAGNYQRVRKLVDTFFTEREMVKDIPKPKTGANVDTRQNTILTMSLTLVLLAFIFAIVYYKSMDRRLMAANIEAAIAKNIDPLAVRCSYANGDDNICVAYAISNKSIDAPKR
jgi:preprotein translocase subunit SecY